uniref:Candidate secreted effector n=1 Tax=Meloidogyne incognita TaxID=6306 RepID=A0A914LDW0_MELIC
MNIQIGLVMETIELICNQHVFFEFEALASLKSEEKAEINFFEIGRIEGDEEVFIYLFFFFFGLLCPVGGSKIFRFIYPSSRQDD